MAKSYLLYRCGNEGIRIPVMFFTADSEEEAREAPTWLRRHHPESELLRLRPGEFFEIIEQTKCPPEEWESAVATLKVETPAH
ncbi:hypothetical protein [Fundidesulfovibrio terrae]|uniref:hypothetical protein n=1 Tax=Fundidesulfovibrio terrae TaxID=2922866 RepID=UPI001FAF7B21|nr:hypothetical protein [Fundidesulfovibrio terrae]